MAETPNSYNYTPSSFKYYHSTIPERLRLMADQYGGKPAFIFRNVDGSRHVVTAKDSYQKAVKLGQSLVNLGIEKGDVVAMCVANDAEGLIATLGVVCAGGIVVHLLVSQDDRTNLQSELANVKAKCLILAVGGNNSYISACDDFISSTDVAGKVDCVSLPSLQYVICTSKIKGKHVLTLTDLLEKNVDTALPSLDPEDIFAYFSTSGSTRKPKYVLQTHNIAMIHGFVIKCALKYNLDDIYYNIHRFSRNVGFPYWYFFDGLTTVSKVSPIASFTEHCKVLIREITEENCTIASLHPEIICEMLDLIAANTVAWDGPLLRNIYTGGLNVAAACMHAIGTISDMVTNCYGSTETGIMSYFNITKISDFIDHSAGFPGEGVEIKVVGENGMVVKRNEFGSIQVRSPHLFPGYLNMEETRQAFTANRWMNTGDIGFMTNDGSIVVSGRASDIILQDGKYHFPSNVEAFLKTHPNVHNAVVISIPGDYLLERVCACIVPKPDQKLTVNDIRQFYGAHFNETHGQLRLAVIEFFETFPKLLSGKLDKSKLKELVAEKQSVNVN